MKNFSLYRQAGRTAGKRPGAAPARPVQDKHNWLADLAEWMMKDEVRAAEFPVTTLEEVQAERERLAGKLHSLDVSLDLVQNAPYQRQALECMTCAWNDVIDATETIDAVCRGTLGCIRKGGDARADMPGCPLWQGEADLLAPHRKGVFEIPDMGLTLSDFTMKAEAFLAAARARKDADLEGLKVEDAPEPDAGSTEDAACPWTDDPAFKDLIADPAPAADEEEPVDKCQHFYALLDKAVAKAAAWEGAEPRELVVTTAEEREREAARQFIQRDILVERASAALHAGVEEKEVVHYVAEAEFLLNDFCARMQRAMNQEGGRA